MCAYLNVSRSSVYYQSVRKKNDDTALESFIKTIWKNSRQNYGSRNIKRDLDEHYGLVVSRRKIRRIMVKLAIQSNYQVKVFRPKQVGTNYATNENYLQRDFIVGLPHITIVSDLTYVKVKDQWNYICAMIDLYNGEIVGFSCGRTKESSIVQRAFSSINFPLYEIEVFHTDRGAEFKNNSIDELLEFYDIQHSLSRAGKPIDNAVAEATMKIIKTEFAKKPFGSFTEMNREFEDYVNYYNNIRRHSRNNHQPPSIVA